MTILKFFMLLALSVWLGGIIFFTAVEAPSILNLVADRQLGGAIISQSLWRLHWVGIACGLVYLVAALRLSQVMEGAPKAWRASHLLALLMIGFTLISQRAVLPAIALLRIAQPTPAVQAQFQQLHGWSVGLEGGTLLLGLILLFLTARRLS